MRPAGMARHLDLLPGRQLGIGVFDQLIGLGLQARDVGIDLHRRVLRRKLAQLDDLAFQFGDGTFEIEIGVHGVSVGAAVDTLGPKRAGKVAMSLSRVNLR